MDFFEALWLDIQKICGDTVVLGTNNVATLNIIVWSLFIGFLIGIAVTVYNRLVLGPVVNGLVDSKALNEESALPIAEVSRLNPFIRFALRSKSSFRRVIKMVGDTETSKSRESFENARFYIPQENIKRAQMISGSGMSLVSVLLSVLVFFVIALIAFIVVPDLISMASNFAESIAPDSNVI